MFIQRITSEHARDFSAILECEHCQQTQRITTGYHDTHYHTKVIPAITCTACGKDRSGRVPETANDEGRVPVMA